MNTRSLKFRLVGWYAGLVVGLFSLLAATTYLVLRESLVRALKENQLRRGRQISQLLREEIERQVQAGVGAEVEARYAPELNARLVRITRADGRLLYCSARPKDQSFEPADMPPPVWPVRPEAARQVPLAGGHRMLIAVHTLQMPDGTRYLVETGALMDDLQAELHKWLLLLAVILPAVAASALAGGYVLVKRALSPVDRITASAARISSHNLDERLPIPQTGDELERLSVALNRMIDRLDEAFQYSRRFVADASHELRTPLTSLRGELELLVQQPHLSAEWRDRVGSALEEVGRLSHIVESLFAISRLDAGEAAAQRARFDLGQLASSTADQMSLLADDKEIKLTCANAANVWVEGDRARLKQVIVNLVDNAIKYTPSGGTVSLTVSRLNQRAVLEVADNGVGIPAEALPRVFERFFRVDKSRSRDEGGAGLGLAIVKSICAAHGGRVEVDSAPGKGSRFRVELPLVAALDNPPPAQNHQEPQSFQPG